MSSWQLSFQQKGKTYVAGFMKISLTGRSLSGVKQSPKVNGQPGTEDYQRTDAEDYSVRP